MMIDSGNLIRRGINYLNYRFAPHAVILMYHRVVDSHFDPQLLRVTLQHFDEHLEILCRYAYPISLQGLNASLQNNKIPHHGVVITFDDGYYDNLHYAKPLLERHDLPATIFVTAGQIGCQNEFWWDELDRLLLLPGRLPSMLDLNLNGSDYHWVTRDATEYTEEDYQQYQDWHIEQTYDPSPRHSLYRSIYHLLHSLNGTERRGMIEELQAWANQTSRCRPSHRTLSMDEVSQLAEGGLIEIGAHTMTHPVLTNLPVSVQRQEIIQSKAYLEEISNHPVTSFSYPHGSYADETVSIIKEAGFSSACSSDSAVISDEADMFRLPRFSMRDWNGEEFYRWLKGLIHI